MSNLRYLCLFVYSSVQHIWYSLTFIYIRHTCMSVLAVDKKMSIAKVANHHFFS